MDEQEILAVLREHVARSQSNGSKGQPSASTSLHPDRVDQSQLDHASAELWRLRNRVGELNPRHAGFLNRAAQAFKKAVQRSLSWHTRSLHEYHDVVNQAIECHARAITSLQQQILQLGGGLPELLQEALWTERRATQEQQAPYAQLFHDLSPVLDLGCGRGDFLELLQKEEVSAYGVDSDHRACEEARQKFLKVVEGDLFEHLAQVPDRSLGGIFCARVLEYLPTHLQAKLVSSSAAKLKPGGLLVIETINPDSDVPFGRTSHVDPSHLRAIYPEVLQSIVESSGFEHCRICVLAPQQVCVIAGPDSSASSHDNDGTGERVSSAGLSRAPAYAAIARRK